MLTLARRYVESSLKTADRNPRKFLGTSRKLSFETRFSFHDSFESKLSSYSYCSVGCWGGVNGWTVLQLFAVFHSPHRLQSGRGGELHLTMTNFSMICTPPNIQRNFFNFVFCLVLGVQLSMVQAFKWTGECFFIFKAIISHTRPVFIVFIQCAEILIIVCCFVGQYTWLLTKSDLGLEIPIINSSS